MSEECKDCPYQIGNNSRIDKIEKDMDHVWDRLKVVENSTIRQEEQTNRIFEILGELKSSLKNIELAVYNKEDNFKKIIYDLGLWSLKVLVGGGAVVWAVAEFGVK